MWLYGSALWYWRHRAPMSWGVFAALVGVLVLASFNKQAAFIAYLVCMAPLVLHLAYLPGGFLRRYSSAGDYSYGVYIYAFPAQQSLAFWFPGISLFELLLSSGLIAFTAAGLSWHFIEKRALRMKHRCAEATERVLSAAVARIATAALGSDGTHAQERRLLGVAVRRLQAAVETKRETSGAPN